MTNDLPIEDNVALEAEREELERKIELLEMARINLRVTPVTFDRLLKIAEFNNQTIEDYCIDVLNASLNQLVGKPSINAPSNLSGSAVTKVMGPSGSVTRG